MMSQQSGDPFAALIRVNTVLQAVVGNGNRDIRGETRAEYQGRQEGQKTDRHQSKMRETVQSQNTMIKQRKMTTLRHHRGWIRYTYTIIHNITAHSKPTTSGYKSDALSIRPQLPTVESSVCFRAIEIQIGNVSPVSVSVQSKCHFQGNQINFYHHL